MDTLRPGSRLEKDVTGQGSKRWYVVHAYSGFEKSVQRALEDRINRAGMNDKFGKILVPVEATYSRPYLSHASLGPSCAVAKVEPGQVTVWSHTQGPFPLRGDLATAL